MFIKAAYEKRLRRETEDQEGGSEPKLHKIGSFRNQKINYAKDEQFFSKQDVPQNIRAKKREVLSFIDPDHLGLKRKDWNSSVTIPKMPHLEESHERKLIRIKLGLLDYPIPAYKPPLSYEGLQFRDDYSGWNVSTSFDQRESASELVKLTKSSLLKTKKVQKALVKSGYVSPMASVKLRLQQQRKQQEEDSGLREQMRLQFIHLEPAASKERAEAAVFRMANQHKLADLQKQVVDSECVFKPNLTRTLKQRATVRKIHDGHWGPTLEGMAWSCCQSEDREGEGCLTRKKDRQRWNLVSFTNS